MAGPVITDKEVIQLVRQEFERRLKDFCIKQNINLDNEESIEKTPESEPLVVYDDEDEPEEPKKKSKVLDMNDLSAGIRTKHKESGLEYYIQHIDNETGIIELETPEGHTFKVDLDELELEYELG